MNETFPSVCVCIPTYNAETTITETLASTLGQTYPNLKILLLDNASTDRTVEIAESFADERISILHSEVNIGALGNFNRCIEVACGKYTIMFHADEVYEPEMVSKQVAVLERYPEVGAVFTEALLIDEAGKIFGETKVAKYVGRDRGEIAVFTFDELFPVILRSGNFLLCSGAMVRTDIYQSEIKTWRADMFSTSCDLDVWLRILERHKVALILENLMRTRTSRGQASYTELKRNTNRADMFLVLDYYLEKARPRDIINEHDLAGYASLQRMDVARRAMNLYLLERFKDAGRLVRRNLKLGLVISAFGSKRGLLTFLLTIYLTVMLMLGLDKLGLRILRAAVIRTRG